MLSHLACASLNEDRYGVVQRDLPKILEGLLSFLGTLEDYRAEIVGTCPSHDTIAALTGEEREDKLRILQDVTQAVEPLDQLQDGACLLLRELPPRVAEFRGDQPSRTELKISLERSGGDCRLSNSRRG